MPRLQLRHYGLHVFLAAAVMFCLAPFVAVLLNSFSGVGYNVFPPPSWSLQWYQKLLEIEAFRSAALRSIGLGVTATILSLMVGTATAYALARSRSRFAEVIRAVMMAPFVVPKIVIGVGCFMFFASIGLPSNWGNLLLVHVLVTFPFVLSIVGSTLARFDWTLQEAAFDLGASRARTIFLVVLPDLYGSLAIAGVFVFITSFDQVETTLFLTDRQHNTLPIEMLFYLERFQDPTLSALSVVIIAFTLLLVFLASRLFGEAPALVGK